MPDAPVLGLHDELLEDFGATASSIGTTTTAGAANVKGNYAQLVAATAHHATALTLILRQSATPAELLVDLAIGAAGSEQVIVSNVLFSKGNVNTVLGLSRLPVVVPKGVRLAARVQSSTASGAIAVRGSLHAPASDSLTGFSFAEGIGAVTGTSRGTGVDAGGVANTKGTYAQLVASTARPYRGFYVLSGNAATATRGNATFLTDIAVGAAAAEQVIVPNLQYEGNTNEVLDPRVYGPFMVTIPTGSRLAARCQSPSIVAADRVMDVVLLGFS
jgi:hypothetical protein